MVLLHGGVVAPKGKLTSAGTASVVVGFRQLLRPDLLASRMAGSPRFGECIGGGMVGGGDVLGSTAF